MNSGYLIERYIPTISHVDLDSGFIRERVEYKRRVQRVLSTKKIGSSCAKKNSFVLVSGNEEVGGDL